MSTEIRKVGRPSVDSEQLRARMPRDLVERIDAWRGRQEDKPARPEAVRRLVERALDQEGE